LEVRQLPPQRRTSLQKLFSAFPTGSPGFGLLLLRAFVALTLVAQSLTYVKSADSGLLNWLPVALAIVTGGCLLIGFLTPVMAVVIAGGAIAFAILFDHNYTTVSIIILAPAIALLGPGAFSVDARLFGRREILIPNLTRHSKL
jgi:uncharacterized membrane protein